MPNFFTTPTGAGALDGSSFANAFNWAGVDNWVTNVANAGDILYALAGTYNSNAHVGTSRDGTIAAPIQIIGVADTALTPAAHGALPFFDFGALNASLVLDNYWTVRNIRIESAENNYCLRCDIGGVIDNCEAENTGTGHGFSINSAGGRIMRSIALSAANAGIMVTSNCAVYGCQVTGGAEGISLIGSGNALVGNLVRDCTTGIGAPSGDNVWVLLNTINGCTTGILSTDGQNWLVADNILSNNTTPANWSGGAQPKNAWQRNVWFNSATPINVTKGADAINADPQFVDASLGTVAGFTVRAAAARELGINLFTAGAIPPSIYEGGENGIGGSTTTDLDLSDDILSLCPLETIDLDGTEVQNTYRLRDTEEEEVATEGVYLRRDTTFLLPVGDTIYPAGTEPTVGGIITEAAAVGGASYTIMKIRRPRLGTAGDPLTGDWYRAEVVSLRISDAFGFNNTVTHWPRTEATTEWGSRTVTHAASTTFVNVEAKIMLRPSPIEDHAGQREFTRHYDIFVDGDIGDIESGDQLRDEDGEKYEITGYRLQNRIGELSVIECEIRPD